MKSPPPFTRTRLKSLYNITKNRSSHHHVFVEANVLFDAIQTIQPILNPFVSWIDRQSLEHKLRESKDRIISKKIKSPLEGCSIVIKDNICTKDYRTTAGSAVLKSNSWWMVVFYISACLDFVPPYNADVVNSLEKHGLVILGKTNMDEFGMGCHGPSYHPYPLIQYLKSLFSSSGSIHQDGDDDDNNSFNNERDVLEDLRGFSPGGSSGGSAISVSLGIASLALGSDTGGSIRLPASYCGVVGFKPSYGRLSRYGLIAYANSLDTIGIIGKSVPLVQQVFDLLTRDDVMAKDNDMTHWQRKEDIESDLQKPFNIGIPREMLEHDMDVTIRSTFYRLLDDLKQDGHNIIPISMPSLNKALASYYIISTIEASSNLARYEGMVYGGGDGSSNEQHIQVKATDVMNSTKRRTGHLEEDLGSEATRRVLLGKFLASQCSQDHYYTQAQEMRNSIRQEFDHFFNAVTTRTPSFNIILSPTSTTTAPKVHDCLIWQREKLIKHQGSTLTKGDNDLNELRKVYPTKLEDLDIGPMKSWIHDVMTVPASLAGIPALSIPFHYKEPAGHGLPFGLQLMGPYGKDEEVLSIAKRLSLYTKE